MVPWALMQGRSGMVYFSPLDQAVLDEMSMLGVATLDETQEQLARQVAGLVLAEAEAAVDAS